MNSFVFTSGCASAWRVTEKTANLVKPRSGLRAHIGRINGFTEVMNPPRGRGGGGGSSTFTPPATNEVSILSFHIQVYNERGAYVTIEKLWCFFWSNRTPSYPSRVGSLKSIVRMHTRRMPTTHDIYEHTTRHLSLSD